MKKPELLAPAGDLVRMKYAFAYGADAVYAGQPAFSLRARENGFKNLDDLAEGIEYAHRLGKKFYLTSNVIPRNVKVEAFQKALLAAIDLKPDALIVADPGFVGWLREVRPEVEIHLSVQANTTNYLAAKFWHDLGVSRVILSRELRLSEILEIKDRLAVACSRTGSRTAMPTRARVTTAAACLIVCMPIRNRSAKTIMNRKARSVCSAQTVRSWTRLPWMKTLGERIS